jgi:hypothetical protein
VIKQPNYTFSVPDKRIYTLLKSITVTPRFVRASSVSSHGQPSFTRRAFCLSFVRRPLHVRRAYVQWGPSDRARAIVRPVPSAPKRPTTPLRPWKTSATLHATGSRPASERFPANGFLDRFAPSTLKLCSSETTVGESAPARQHTHTHASSNVSILIRSSLHALNHFVHLARGWRSAPAVTGHF